MPIPWIDVSANPLLRTKVQPQVRKEGDGVNIQGKVIKFKNRLYKKKLVFTYSYVEMIPFTKSSVRVKRAQLSLSSLKGRAHIWASW